MLSGDLKRFFLYMKRYKVYFILAFVSVLVSAFNVLGLGLGINYFVNRGIHESTHLIELLLFFIFFGITMSIAMFGRIYFINMGGGRVIVDIRCAVYQHLLSLSAAFFERKKIGELIAIVVTNTNSLENFFSGSLTVILRHFITMLCGFSMLIYSSPKLTLYIVIVMPFVVTIIFFLGKKVKELALINKKTLGMLASSFEDNISSVKLIQSFANEAFFKKIFADEVEDSYKAFILYTIYRAGFVVLVTCSMISAVVFVLWTGMNEVLVGNLDSGSLVSFLFYVLLTAGSVSGIGDHLSDLQHASASLRELFTILDEKPDIINIDNPVSLNSDVTDIVFENVSFRYPSRPDMYAVSNFNLHIKAGETVALVGPSGVGKSTIFELLMRFYDIESGDITINGVSIRELDLHELRSLFGWVPQEVRQFSTTVAKNITYAEQGADHDSIMDVLTKVDLYDFVNQLPEKLETFVGEKGVRMSGGQKQRMALARVLLKNPKVFLLDEATSALDSNSEKIIQDRVYGAYKNRIKIIIAHRLFTVLDADRIVLVKDGKVEDQGKHEKLFESNELYRKLATLQFQQ